MNPSDRLPLLSGCSAVLFGAAVIRCSPVATVKRYGVEAVLADHGSGEPIRKSPVMIRVDGKTFEKRTDRKGRIAVPADREWHWSWFGGPAWMSNPEAEVEIICAGYEPVKFRWARCFGNDPSFPEARGVIRMGVVAMDRRGGDGSASPGPVWRQRPPNQRTW